MMSITPTSISTSASPRPYAGVLGSCVSTTPNATATAGWMFGHDASTGNHDAVGTTGGSKRPHPGSLAGVLT